MGRINELHLEHPFMGASMLVRQLQRRRIHVGQRHMGKLAQRIGIQALVHSRARASSTPTTRSTHIRRRSAL